MVRRTELTPEVVNDTAPPIKGEIRIADTKCQGFGFRIWRTAGGVGRAFDLRAKDASGRFTRRTYKPRHNHPNFAFGVENHLRGTFAFFLDDAREWAEEERFRIMGLPTPQEVAWEEHRHARADADAMSLCQHTERFLAEDRSQTWSDAYKDGIRELIYALPEQIRDIPIGDVDPKVFIQTLTEIQKPFFRVQKLREFVSKLVQAPSTHGAGYQLQSRETTDLFHRAIKEKFGPGFQARLEPLRPMVPKVLHALAEEEELWVQAAALRMYLQTGAKQAPILKATWDTIFEGHWYPYLPSERSSWFWAREPLSDELMMDLDTLRVRVRATYPKTSFLFPSVAFGGHRPISSVDRCWRRVLRKSGWQIERDGMVPLADFARLVSPRSRPSDLLSHPMTVYLEKAHREAKQRSDAHLSKIGKT